MQQRSLGRQGLTVSALGHGSMGTVLGYGPSDEQESVAAIRRAHELGVTHFDTAERYGWGEGERLLGRAIAPIRDDVTVATKFGLTEAYGPDSDPDRIRTSIDNSLRNLGVDHIDVLYQHLPDPAVPVEDVVETMGEYVRAGKVRHLGLSNVDEDTLRRAHAVHPVSVVQNQYSLFSRGVESLFGTLDELGVGLVAYAPLARGFLSGAVASRESYAADDFRRRNGWWAPRSYEANRRLAWELSAVADEKGITLAQLALAWLLGRREDVVPIPGSRHPDRVAQNVAAAEIDLTAHDLARIEAVVPSGEVVSTGG
jgi:aryl-alcohol dehydrogenase-like predicted oxidoreductase